MSLDYQQIHTQVNKLGEEAPRRARRREELYALALQTLSTHASQLDTLREKVSLITRQHDSALRCALPMSETLNARHELPKLPAEATVLAADGSQINLDRHAAAEYCLINVGAIQSRLGAVNAPVITVRSQLYYDEELYTATGKITEATLALMRDLHERELLAELAQQAELPVIALTDGPIELWGAKERGGEGTDFQQHLQKYLAALEQLSSQKVGFAGYVDKPGANWVTRLLEVALAGHAELPNIRNFQPLRGITDLDLYINLISPGERSGVFAIQSQSARNYQGPLGLCFFYLNVGTPAKPWLARVEIPAWVAENEELLDSLHAVLVAQCKLMGARPYPYLLHRAHETALVSFQEREQVTQMIIMELQRRGVAAGQASHKQAHKELAGKTRYKR